MLSYFCSEDLSAAQKFYRVFVQWIGKCLALLLLLYFFVCSLDLLSSAFRLVGGKTAGAILLYLQAFMKYRKRISV